MELRSNKTDEIEKHTKKKINSNIVITQLKSN